MTVHKSAIVANTTEWIMDSAVSYHMCPRKDWFVNFEIFDGPKVFMGNNNTCKIEGVGKICLKMNDGVIHELEDVRYVSELKKNLISLGELDSKGFEMSLNRGVLRVKSNGLVVMKGLKHGNLYFLQGNTYVGETLAAVSDIVPSNTTRLWKCA